MYYNIEDSNSYPFPLLKQRQTHERKFRINRAVLPRASIIRDVKGGGGRGVEYGHGGTLYLSAWKDSGWVSISMRIDILIFIH
jgi:hypothetical protein